MVMDLSDKEALRDAVDRLAVINPLPPDLLADYLAGGRDRLLYYEKVTGGDTDDVPALWKYCAQTRILFHSAGE